MTGSKTHWFIGHQTHQWEVQLRRAVILVAVSLSLGVLGYHGIAGLGHMLITAGMIVFFVALRRAVIQPAPAQDTAALVDA